MQSIQLDLGAPRHHETTSRAGSPQGAHCGQSDAREKRGVPVPTLTRATGDGRRAAPGDAGSPSGGCLRSSLTYQGERLFSDRTCAFCASWPAVCVCSVEGDEESRGRPRQNRGVCTMKQFLFPAVLAAGFTFVPSTAQASWLSEALHRLRGDYAYPGYYGGYAAPGYYGAPGYYDYGDVSPGYYESYYTPGYYSYGSYPSTYWNYSPSIYTPRYYGGYGYRGYRYPWYGHHHDGHWHGGWHGGHHHHH